MFIELDLRFLGMHNSTEHVFVGDRIVQLYRPTGFHCGRGKGDVRVAGRFVAWRSDQGSSHRAATPVKYGSKTIQPIRHLTSRVAPL